MTANTYRCTCIKPFPFNHQTIRIGDEIQLTESQARPLQHGGFITLDDAAGKLIRALIHDDDEPAFATEDTQDNDNATAAESEIVSRPLLPSSTQAVGYEIGD